MTLQKLRTCFLAFVLGLTGCSGSAVRDSEDAYVEDDRAITTRVQHALAEALSAGVTALKVQTFKGVVLLSGVVDSAGMRQRALAIARDVEGVEFVKDNIQVK
jgi:osmotically-inducible protein OsmY